MRIRGIKDVLEFNILELNKWVQICKQYQRGLHFVFLFILE